MRYDRAVAYLKKGDDKPAAAALRDFLAAHGDHALARDALRSLAATERRLGDHEASQKYAEQFLKKYGDDANTPDMRLLSAENAFSDGDFERAAAEFEAFVAQFPKHPQVDKARFRLGVSLYRLGRVDAAIDPLRASAAHADEDESFAAALLILGEIQFDRGEWKDAQRWLDQYAMGHPQRASADAALLKLGLARQREQKLDDALEAFDAVLHEFKDGEAYAHALFERGQTLILLDRGDEAARAFENLLKRDDAERFKPFALNHLGVLAMQQRDYDSAIGRFEALLALKPEAELDANARYQRAAALMALDKYAEAEKAFSGFVKRYPEHNDANNARAQRAIALSRSGRFDDAIAAIDESLPVLPEGDALRETLSYEKAWCQRKLGRANEAGATYRTMLASAESSELSAHAVLELAELEADAKHFDEAAKLLKPLCERAAKRANSVPDDVLERGLYRLGICRFELDDFEEASRWLGDLLDKFPKTAFAPSAGFYCGEALFHLGRHDAAVKRFQAVIDEYSDDDACGPSMLRQGECFAVLQQWPRSERVFAEYLARHPKAENWFQARFGIAWAQENQGRQAEAIEGYRAVVDKHQGPTAARAQFQIGECLYAMKKYDEATRELLKVDILYAYPEWCSAALFEAGRCFEELNKAAEASEQYRAVVEKYKDTKWAALAGQRLKRVGRNAGVPGRKP
jgi:TolA-binding protein